VDLTMIKQKIKAWWPSIALAILILLIPKIFGFVTSIGSHDIEDVRSKMKNYLHKKYGEEFMVDRIGTRSSRGQKFYQARIYPKSILGTNKEGDSYYYASATADKLPFGRLDGVGDSYSYVSRNIDMENYLLPQVKKKFGERVLLKVDVEHKVTGDGSWWAGYKSKSLKEMRKKVRNDPEHNRIELDLDVYIFDRIENKEEKEKRRKEIFEFVQYLKEEGLFEYLEMRIVFVDQRVLASSYDEFDQQIYSSDKVEKYIKEEDTTVEFPPKKLREEMSKELQREIDEMTEEELLLNMQKIRKDELTYEEIRKRNSHYQSIIYSEGILKEKYSTSLEKHPEVLRDYEEEDDVKLGPNLEYIYIN
jgi:hypothetical protein